MMHGNVMRISGAQRALRAQPHRAFPWSGAEPTQTAQSVGIRDAQAGKRLVFLASGHAGSQSLNLWTAREGPICPLQEKRCQLCQSD